MSEQQDKFRMLFNIPESYPFKDQCEDCEHELLHHHTGPKTKGLPHEGLNYYCWCLDVQEP